MSCIVAINNYGKVYMGADSCASGLEEQRTRKDQKIFIKGDYLVGVTGAPRIAQLIKYQTTFPKHKDQIPSTIREVLLKNNCITNTEEEGELIQAAILIAYKGELFEILSDFQIAEYNDNYYAIGCGRPYALASLYETKNEKSQIQRVKRALQCSEYFCVGVRNPFHIFTNDQEYSCSYKVVHGVTDE